MARSSGQAARLARSKAQSQPRNAIAPLTLTLVSTVAFCLFMLLPRVRANNVMLATFGGVAVALFAALIALRAQVVRAGRELFYEANLKPVHYVQLFMHSSVYAYWGFYWRAVYHFIPLILAQLAFAYALDMLVCWSRRDKYLLGFGPFPIILSTNLFLWFKDEYFYLQFALIAAGVFGKEFIKWKRDGKLTHIFNPSAFSLSLFSLLLILTHNTAMSWGTNIASTQQRPPYIYVEIFLLGMVVQALFQVTLVTLFSGVSLYALNLWFTHHTGSYMFIDSNIPAAVFLGMHLLVTDPATSPRSNFGKVLFGLAYGSACFGLFWWFDRISVPTFYDKLLPVPFLNLLVPATDRACRALEQKIRGLDLGAAMGARKANWAHMAVWVTLFAVMAVAPYPSEGMHFVGAAHPGQNLAFWQQACSEGRYGTCHYLETVLGFSCADQSGSSCMAQGEMLAEGRGGKRDDLMADQRFSDACSLGEGAACVRLGGAIQAGADKGLQRACDDGSGESCVSLGMVYRGGIGVPRDPTRALALYEAGCRAGVSRGCGLAGDSYAFGVGVPVDNSKAMADFDRSCRHDYGPGCFNVGMMYRRGIGVAMDETQALEHFRAACDLGFAKGCEPDELDSSRSSR